MSPQDRLGGLTEREREVLQLKCEGADYKAIAEGLNIGLPTVKHHMGNIFVKLGLDHLARDVRSLRLHQIYCPLLQQGISQPPPPEPENPEPLPESVAQAVEEDEMPLVLYTPPRREQRPPPDEPPVIIIRSNEGRARDGDNRERKIFSGTSTGFRSWSQFWLIPTAFFLGIILTSIVFLLFVRNNSLNAENEIPLTPIVLVAEVTVLITTTPEPTQAVTPVTIEPQIITIEVVVTATPLPATETPTPPLETSTPTNTPEPSATSTPSFALPFQDNFDEGLRPEWRVVAGQPVFVNGRLQASGLDTVTLQIGDNTLSNYTAHFYYETCYDSFGLTTVTIGGKVRFLIDSTFWDWEGFQDGGWLALPGSPIDSFCDGDLQIQVAGSSYTVTVNGAIILESIYGVPTSGPFTLSIRGRQQVVDNFSITSP